MSEIDPQKLIDFIAAGDELENVGKMKKQLTYNQAQKLLHVYSKQEIYMTLLEMENYAMLTKKYRSVYLTLRNWIELKHKLQRSKGRITKDGRPWRTTHAEALSWLEKQHLPLSQLEEHFKPVEINGKTVWEKKI